MTAHAWTPAGRMDDGSQRYTCSRCGAGQHWPGIGATCEAEMRAIGRGKAAPPVRFPTQVRIVPDAAPNRTCKVCGKPYHSEHHRSRNCSPKCSRASWLAANAAAYEARKAKRATATPEEIEAQRARSAGYAQAYRERQAAE